MKKSISQRGANIAKATLFILIAALGVMPLIAQADELEDGTRLLKAHDYDGALLAVNAHLNTHPRAAKGRFLKGLIQAEQNKINEAIETFVLLTRDYPNLPEPYNNLAVLYASLRHYDKALAALEAAIHTHPSYAMAHENLRSVYTQLASQAYDKALQLDKKNSAAQTKLVLIKNLSSQKPPAPQPVVVAQPAPASNARDAEKTQVLKAVHSWAQAWSNQDVNAYLTSYAPDFKTPNGESRSAWEALRRERVKRPKQVKVSILSPNVSMRNDGAVEIRFVQKYKSNLFSSRIKKSLTLTKNENKWLILQEKTGP